MPSVLAVVCSPSERTLKAAARFARKMRFTEQAPNFWLRPPWRRPSATSPTPMAASAVYTFNWGSCSLSGYLWLTYPQIATCFPTSSYLHFLLLPLPLGVSFHIVPTEILKRSKHTSTVSSTFIADRGLLRRGLLRTYLILGAPPTRRLFSLPSSHTTWATSLWLFSAGAWESSRTERLGHGAAAHQRRRRS